MASYITPERKQRLAAEWPSSGDEARLLDAERCAAAGVPGADAKRRG